MKNSSDQIREMIETLSRQLSRNDLDVVDILPVPTHGDRMVRLRTLEEIVDEFSRGEENGAMSYLVRIQPRDAAPPLSTPLPPAAKPLVESMYLDNGNLNLPYLLKNAELLRISGEYASARHIYQAVLKTGERSAAALFGIGRCYESEGNLLEAAKNYEESIAYHPALEAYQTLALLLIRLKKDQEAAELYERALLLKDVSASVRYEMHKSAGCCWAKTSHPEKAQRHYKKALEVDPAADEIQTLLGSLFFKMGKFLQARQAYQDALASNPINDKALFGMGLCLVNDGDKRQAHDYFAQSLDISLNNPDAIFQLVKCAYEIKSYATAARILEDYIEIAPVNASILYSLAGLQYHLGRLVDARKTSERIFQIQPQHAGAKELLTLIERYTHGH